ncbi:MAG TPA: FAD-binding oxidoreductase [Gemmatimonadaceae bacterium]|nr:FAD-binding oxidoreductase [Gemmatimonadaceae bacterium]
MRTAPGDCALTARLGPPPGFRGSFRSDDLARALYSEAAGIARAIPSAIAVPLDRDDLIRLVRWASDSGVALIPRGSASSMAGGAVGRGIVVDVSRWRSIGPVDVNQRLVRAGPGAICSEVDAAARAHGLRLPVDPSSAAFCTIGGMTATNASGPHTLAFGSMRRWVRAIECVFADGSVGELRRGNPSPDLAPLRRFTEAATSLATRAQFAAGRHDGVRKDSSGYGIASFAESGDAVDVLVGSEGTLAFFTSIEVALLPTAGATSSLLGAFASLDQAAIAAGRARDLGAVACELLDRTFVEIAAVGGLVPVGTGQAEAVLLAEVEGRDLNGAAATARRLADEFRASGATAVHLALDAATEKEMWALRHAASPILARLDPSLCSMQFIEDGAVPPDRLSDYVLGVRAALDRQETRGVVFGHAGDAHVHVNALVDVTVVGWRDRLNVLLDEVTGLVSSLGGTISGEHGDGRLRTPLLDRVWPQGVRDAFALVKHSFDPAGLLNPGVKIFVAGESGAPTIKYDPTLPPLAGNAAGLLKSIERDRGYARFRLDL